MRIAILSDELETGALYEKKIRAEFQRCRQRVQLVNFSHRTDLNSGGEPYDVLFVNITLSDRDRIAFAAEQKKRMPNLIIVFFLESDSDMWNCFSASTIHFVGKDNLDRELSCVVQKCVATYQSQHKMLVFENGIRVYNYEIEKIVYVEAAGKGVILHTEAGNITVRLKISDMELALDAAQFIKIHRSYLVNCQYIKALFFKCVKLNTGESLPVSKYRASEVRRQYAFYQA